ncbi:Ssh1 protein [Starmerella bacillaris]|uniref:Ssh1 protein n=1 Tax=Starmerella bacillaris TaxID=1247836 RepID=A0AAV5RFA2_STABA|nr:Ssh1 protein [Starmerella bacillaris]
MARVRLLDLVKPFSLVLPEVEFPYQKVDQFDRIIYTVGAAIIYAILCEIPVWGLKSPLEAVDPISWLRPGLGMSHGSLAEFGVVPIVISGMIIQICAGLRKLKVSLDVRSDRALFQTAQKLGAIVITAILSFFVTFGGGFEVTGGQIIIFFQFFLGGVCIIYLDEVLSKKYGLISGSLLFSSIKVAQHFAWSLLSIQSIQSKTEDGWNIFGVIPSLINNLSSRSYQFAVTDAVFRGNGYPNVIGIIFAFVVFLGVIYISLFRLNLQIRMTKMRNQSSQFPIRLVYTGSMPLLLSLSLLAAYLIISFSISNIVGASNPVIRILGAWDPKTALPISGIAAAFVPKWDSNVLLILPKFVVYTAFLTLSGAWIAKAWVASSGSSPQDLAKMFKENAVVLVGKRDVTVLKELRSIIPSTAVLGAVLTSACVAAADLFGPAGWGSTMTVAALNAFTMVEVVSQEGAGGMEAMQSMM